MKSVVHSVHEGVELLSLTWGCQWEDRLGMRVKVPGKGTKILPTVQAHDLEGFLLGTRVCPAQYISLQDGEGTSNAANSSFGTMATPAQRLNLEYVSWIRTNQALMSWLLASNTKAMLRHVVRCTSQVLSDEELLLYILGGLGSEYDPHQSVSSIDLGSALANFAKKKSAKPANGYSSAAHANSSQNKQVYGRGFRGSRRGRERCGRGGFRSVSTVDNDFQGKLKDRLYQIELAPTVRGNDLIKKELNIVSSLHSNFGAAASLSSSVSNLHSFFASNESSSS
ncbi:hypothetical protein PanWU01x14_022350, partial [Parasponia andersonii]